MEQTFRAGEGVLLVEGRVLRRVLKAHRNLKGLGVSVPHVHCYALPRDELLRIAAPEDLDPNVRAQLTQTTALASVILVARLSAAEASRLPPDEVTNRLWRAAFHGRIHVEIEQRMDSGALPEAAVRERIDRIGQTEFDEIREMLRQDDVLLPPGGDREAYAEFVALFLELRFFAPRLLATTFPSLDFAKVEAQIARDVDARLLLERACPEGVDPGATISLATIASSTSSGMTVGPAAAPAQFVAPEGAPAERLLARASRARDKGNRVRAALLHAAVGLGKDPQRTRTAKAREREDLEALGERLKTALRPPPGSPSKPDIEWTSMLLILADEAAARSRGLRYPVEARLLYDLQNAALAHEKQHHAVDLVTWALSLGKRPVVRPLPATRTIRVARHLRNAERKIKLCRIAPADRKLLTKMLDRVTERADDNVRAELRPKLLAVLDEVGLRPASAPERVARDKLVEELLDQATHHGFLTLGHLRDALSRNHLKLDDLGSAAELWRGDALLRADRALALSLDGVYRPGEAYLRGLQKISSVLFGTPVGRGIVLYAILPIGGAFILLEGITHIIEPVAELFGVHGVSLFFGRIGSGPEPATPAHPAVPSHVDSVTHAAQAAHTAATHGAQAVHTVHSSGAAEAGAGALSGLLTVSFWVTVVFVFGLLHSEAFRGVFLRLVRLVGMALAAVFIRGPRYLLSLPSVERALEGRPARVVLRYALIPGVTATLALLLFLLVCYLERANPGGEWTLGLTLGVFVLTSVALATRLGDTVEDLFVEHVAPTWKMLSHKLLPGLFRAIVDFFRWLMEGLERVIYRVDEALRFREGENRVSLGGKAFAGAIWFFVAYLLRVYVALLIEPYVNPVKQVPMTAAAHKMMLPFAPQVFAFFDAAFSGLGSVVGGTLTTVTAFFFPTVFGFFGWELKENYKLYRASRKRNLAEAVIGHHGETMNGFLVAGFHSGTLPKLFARLRHAARREEELDRAAGAHDPTRKSEGARGRFREGTHEVETSIRHFVEREMLCLLAADPRWPHGPLHVDKVTTSSNRVRIGILCPGAPKVEKPEPARSAADYRSAAEPPPASRPRNPQLFEITFEEQSGYVVAGVSQVGFADALRGHARVLFENALAGLYKLAATDLVREQLEMAIGPDMPYDICDDGLLVWPGPGYVVEALYPLRSEASVIEPSLRGGLPQKPLPPLDARSISFRHQPIAWSAWVYAWSEGAGTEPPRLMSGPSLLPSA
jgi:hypothetical protein